MFAFDEHDSTETAFAQQFDQRVVFDFGYSLGYVHVLEFVSKIFICSIQRKVLVETAASGNRAFGRGRILHTAIVIAENNLSLSTVSSFFLVFFFVKAIKEKCTSKPVIFWLDD